MDTITIFEAYEKARYHYLYCNGKDIDWYSKLRRQASYFRDALIERCKLLDFTREMQQIKEELP